MTANWKDAYERQMECWRWCRSDKGRTWRMHSWAFNAEGLNEGTQHLLMQCYAVEEEKLLGADPYYVSTEMCEVIDAARETFEPEPILATDFLSEAGFVYFARPFNLTDMFDKPVALAGFSWSPMLVYNPDQVTVQETIEGVSVNQTAEFTGHGVIISLYVIPTAEWEVADLGPRPSILPSHHTPWWFGMTFEGNERDETGRATAALQWWKLAQTTLRLMQQKIGHRYHLRPERATRRRAAREGWADRDIVVVRLRREAGEEHHETHGEANYSHRFIVSGHWRLQPYPSEGISRQIWISPYVKGPEDQPLVVRPRRVYTFDR